ITLLPTTHLALNAPATPEIYTLSLHDALPIWRTGSGQVTTVGFTIPEGSFGFWVKRLRDLHIESSRATRFEGDVITIHDPDGIRSEEHTSELQSRSDLVCRLLLEKKKTQAPHT